jgi:hypothetical protein
MYICAIVSDDELGWEWVGILSAVGWWILIGYIGTIGDQYLSGRAQTGFGWEYSVPSNMS